MKTYSPKYELASHRRNRLISAKEINKRNLDYQAKAFSLQSNEPPSTSKLIQVHQELIRQNLQGIKLIEPTSTN